MLVFQRLTENWIILTSVSLASVAWVIAFGGLCALRDISHVSWWIVVYELLLILGITLAILYDSFLHYRLVVLTFLAISIALLTQQIDLAVRAPFDGGGFYRPGATSAYAAGCIIIIMIQFVWVFLFGSEPESYLGRFFYHHPHNVVRQHPEHGGAEMTTDKTMLSTVSRDDAAAPATPHPPTPSVSMMPTPGPMEYREKVQALHPYHANPEDPNELSFEKGETLDIVDRKGNWWQARKADGAVGIIPSNYFRAAEDRNDS